MRGTAIAENLPLIALGLLLSACATMSLSRQFDSGDIAREWQKGWDRSAWDAPKDAVVTNVTDLSCSTANDHRHALWCKFNLHYSSAGSQSTLFIERWLLDPETLAHMKTLRPNS